MTRLLAGSALSLLVAFGATAATAQAADTPPPTETADARPADIVVTAQRREQSAQDVGIAISVLSGQELQTRGVSTVNQLQYQTPGLEVVPAFGGGQPQFRLRGVGFDDYASNNASPVGVYIDEVAKPFPIQTQGLIFDLQRVEVLRGPQGTLYGRNTTGGAINFITNKPGDKIEVGLNAEYGRFDLARIEGYISGPISDTFKVRVSALTEQGGGFQRNRTTGQTLGDADRSGVRAQALWTPAPALDVLLEGHYGKDESDGTGLYLFRPLISPLGVAVQGADLSRRLTGWGGSALFQSVTGIPTDAKPFRDNQTYGGHLNIGYDLGGAKLTSITAYEEFTRREYNDWDASTLAYAGTYFNSHAKTFSQEVRLASDGSGPLTWILGGYYSNEKLRDAFISDFAQYFGFDAITTYRQKTDVLAGFGQAEYKLTDKLTLTGGLRVEHEKRRLIDLNTTTAPFIGLGVSADGKNSYTKVSGKAEIQYELAPGSLLYASASRGVKSGGFTAYNTLTVDQAGFFKPESLWAYEVGSKNSLIENRLRLNVSGFYYDYRNQQVQDAIYDTVYGAVGRIVNAPKSHIYGGEAELSWKPVPELEITQGASWKKGKFDRFLGLNVAASQAAGSAVYTNRKGDDLGFPRWSYNGSATYTAPIGDYRLILQTDYSFRDTLDPALLGPVYKVDSYWLVNGTITLTPETNRWSLGVYGRNILNEKYDNTRNFFLGGIDIASPGRPASYGVRVGLRY